MKPRRYQRDALDALQSERVASTAWPSGKPRLVALPTGTGKGAVQIWHAEWSCDRHPGKPFLSVQPSIPLLMQAADRYDRNGFKVLFEQGERYASPHKILQAYRMWPDCDRMVVVASVQSLSQARRLARFGDGSGSFCGGWIEEAHHAPAASYQRLLRALKSIQWSGDTATPDRKGMADLWDLAYNEMTFDRAVKLGWLTETRFRTVQMRDWDLSKLRKSNALGGITIASMERSMFGDDVGEDGSDAYARLVEAAVTRLRHEVGGRSCMSFWPTVRSTEVAGRCMNAHRPAFAMVGIQAQGRKGGDIREVRRVRAEALKRARAGDILDIMLCMLGSEGLDWPDLDTVALLRQVAATGAIFGAQAIGRCTRPHSTVSRRLSDDMTSAERRALIANSPKPTAEVLLFQGMNAKINLWHPVQLIGGLDVAPDAKMPDLDSGMTIEEMRELMERRRREREEADAERLRLKREREEELRNGPPSLDVPAARVRTYTLDEMRAALHNPTIKDRDVKRWQNRTQDVAPRKRPTEAQRQTLAGMFDTIIRWRVWRSCEQAGIDGRTTTQRMHDRGRAAGDAMYRASGRWSGGGAWNEYKHLRHIITKSPVMIAKGISAPSWPPKKVRK